jgi:hypothetical protein
MIGQSTQDTPPTDVAGAPADAESGPVTAESTALSGPHPPTPAMAKEWGGREGPEPTRYGDWEKNGRCIDF